ncbi:DUF2283 domain-containing protein [Candidatus Woesearchaeota archaeon]|nr:DUF2283 domain-containing protein [Candidatus Woesearchaeota archaeon]
MRNKKHMTGEGEFLYDYKHDILTFRTKGREYKNSIEFQNFVVDIDKENFVTGMRVFDASKVFNMDRYSLRNITEGEFRAKVEDKVITITLNFASRIRNRIIPILGHKQNFTQQITTPLGRHHLADSLVECSASS